MASPLRLTAAFERCYAIESQPSLRIRLSDRKTILETHQAAVQLLSQLLRTYGENPTLKPLKDNLHLGTSKYPEYFAALDVLRAAFTELPGGSWAIYAHQQCVKPHVIWKDSGNQEVQMRAYLNDSELDDLKSVMQESKRVQVVE